jgi:hypothetical protein
MSFCKIDAKKLHKKTALVELYEKPYVGTVKHDLSLHGYVHVTIHYSYHFYLLRNIGVNGRVLSLATDLRRQAIFWANIGNLSLLENGIMSALDSCFVLLG